MASISLTDPVAATTVTAGLHAGNNAALRTAINGGLDNTNVAGGAAIDQTKLAFTAWQTYVPTWTSVAPAPVLNTGTLVGRYAQLGKTVHVYIKMVATAATTFGGANAWTVTVPVARSASTTMLGIVLGGDSGVANYMGMAADASTTTVSFLVPGSGTQYNNVTPFAWGTGDNFTVMLTYEAA